MTLMKVTVKMSFYTMYRIQQKERSYRARKDSYYDTVKLGQSLFYSLKENSFIEIKHVTQAKI